MRIIPAIDLQDGRCVRLKQGKFEDCSVYPQNPLDLANHYQQLGMKHLHVVDLDGAKSGQVQQLPMISKLAQTGLSLQVGGGIRSLDMAEACFEAGLNQLVIGSIAINNRPLVLQLFEQFGPERFILALDVRLEDGLPKPVVHGWQTPTTHSLWEVLSDYQDFGVRDVLCTDIACDGMMAGPNLSLYQEAMIRFPNINWQASGGIRNLADLVTLKNLGLSAAILGRVLYEGDLDLQEAVNVS